MKRRRVVLYGKSVIVGTLRASFECYPDLEVVSLAPPFPPVEELGLLAPDVILFDIESTRPDAAFAMLGSHPSLLLIGIDPSTNQALLWSGRQLHGLSTQDLVQVIETGDPTPTLSQSGNLVP